MHITKEIGDYGEGLAVEFLKKKKYKILGRNIRTRFGEIDILAEQQQTLVICEVKTRSGDQAFGRPEEAVDYWKQQKLIKMAHWLLQERRYEKRLCQIDVIAILLNNLGPRIEHFENAVQ